MATAAAPAVTAGEMHTINSAQGMRKHLTAHFREVRDFSMELCAPLAIEDYVVQSMPDCSPAKWHLAHTTWFFETFILKPHDPGYEPAHPQYNYLFNSYYNAVGQQFDRPSRGLLSRPTVAEVRAYRAAIDRRMLGLMENANSGQLELLTPLISLGLHHEQQHQELILTDLKHLLACNPLHPAYRAPRPASPAAVPALTWHGFEAGVYQTGYEAPSGHCGITNDGFAFDNEGPRHKVWLEDFALASRLVTCGEYLEFMADGGYARPELWLSMGWSTVRGQAWQAPFYWEQRDGLWWQMTLGGMRPVRPDEPVCHVSYFEADAYAQWAAEQWSGARLPTEFEWEVTANTVRVDGSFVEAGHYHPAPASNAGLTQLFGEVWQWTRSQYGPYPGYRPSPGALGEYNGKFMCNQFVLRGASCATPRTHARRTYRNFFPPEARWQFSGIRLAKDI